MTRVLHVSDHDELGGAEVVFRATVAACAELDFEARSVVASPERNPASYVWSRRNLVRMRKNLQEFRPDVVHLQNFYHYWTPSILQALREHKRVSPNMRVVMTAHDFHLVCPNSGLAAYRKGKILRAPRTTVPALLFNRYDGRSHAHSLLKKAQYVNAYSFRSLRDVLDLIISPSDFLMRVFRSCGIRQPMTVVRNPLRLKDLKFPMDGQRSGVVFFGRLTREKGVVEAADKLGSAGIPLDIYGDGDVRTEVQRLSDVHPSVRLHGHLEHDAMLAELGRFSVMIAPSLAAENAPLTVVEAGHSGVKVVAAEGSGAAEMAGLTRLSATYDPSDPGGLVDGVRRMLDVREDNAITNPLMFSSSAYRDALLNIYSGPCKA